MKIRISLMLFIIFILLSFVNKSFAQEILLKNLILDNVKDKIQIRFGIGIEKMEKLRSYLEEGGTLRLNCKAYLLMKKNMWWDEELKVNELIFDLNNNPLTREYLLYNVSQNKKVQSKSLSFLLENEWGNLVLNLGSWKTLPRDKNYALELFVSLKRTDVPIWLKKALFFWSWSIASSKKYRMDFSY